MPDLTKRLLTKHDQLIAKQRQLIQAVNTAKTENDHSEADNHLSAWREGVFDAIRDEHNWLRNALVQDSDSHHSGVDEERPMCLGVFLDWKSEDQRKKDFQDWEVMDSLRAKGANY